MNPQPNILELPPPSDAGDTNPPIQESTNPVTTPPPTDSTVPSPQPPAHPGLSGRRGNGNVARLPKDVRDQINTMLLDGVPYAEIIRRLGDAAKHLKPDHIKEWKKFGHQDWLLERDWLDRLSSKAEFSGDILAAPNSSNLHEAGLRLAASQMFDQLMRFNAASETGASDQPEKFARLVNALSRLTREALAFQKYRDALVKAVVELQQRDPGRDLAAKELLLLVNQMDQTFKVARPNLDQLLAQQASLSSVAPAKEDLSASRGAGRPALHRPSEGGGEEAVPSPSVPPVKNQKSRIKNPELCLSCRKPLPPLLPTGERPDPYCSHCGSALRPPGALVEFCPRCHALLPELLPNGTRPTPNCNQCDRPLPPPPEPAAASEAAPCESKSTS